MRMPWVRVERSICRSDHQQLKHPRSSASARTNAVNLDIAMEERQSRLLRMETQLRRQAERGTGEGGRIQALDLHIGAFQ